MFNVENRRIASSEMTIPTRNGRSSCARVAFYKTLQKFDCQDVNTRALTTRSRVSVYVMWLTRNCVSVCRITSEQSTYMYIDRFDNSLFRISRDALGTSTSTPHSRKEIPHVSCMCLGAGLSCRSTQALYMCDVKETQLCGCAVCSHVQRTFVAYHYR